MRTIIVLLIILGALVAAWFGNRYLQQAIKPGESTGRLVLYMVSVLLLVFIICFIMVFTITRLFPGELMK